MDIEAYSDQFKIRVGDSVLTKHRFYLDTKYWVFMREALLGKATEVQIKIYEKLKDLVKKEVAICPLSPHIFDELMKIGDKEKRLNMAKVMDELSNQVCFISPLNIAGQELLIFVRNCQAKVHEKTPFKSGKYVFTKVALMEESYPKLEGIPCEQIDAIKIQFFDYLSKVTLVEMLGIMRGDFPAWDRKNLIVQLNQGKDDNQDWNSFHEVFMHEIAGILDVVKDEIEKLLVYLHENYAGGSVAPDEIRNSESARLFSASIYNSFDQNKINSELPFFHVNASLYAFIRYNKSQRYKENDLIDFSHAAWALPYCNAFFTEKPLHDWICDKPLRLNEIYDTKVLWNEKDVLNTLTQVDSL